MRRIVVLAALVFGLLACSQSAEYQRDMLLCDGWKFTREDGDFYALSLNEESWEDVSVPHDWAIYGPFEMYEDEAQTKLKSGETGGLPHEGVGWYRTKFDAPAADENKYVELLFDGAMSNAKVFVNGHFVGEWPYGYSSFHFDVTPYLNRNGKDNLLAVRLENLPESSRWYPGAGLYRNVHLIVTDASAHIPIWGTQVIAHGDEETATLLLLIELENAEEFRTEVAAAYSDPTSDGSSENIKIKTKILDPKGKLVLKSDTSYKYAEGYCQSLIFSHPELWSPETPNLYSAVTEIYVNNKKTDTYTIRFGVRNIELRPGDGFYLNGKKRKIQGVCLHHDLGPLGAAVNESAIRHQLTLLKEMGCDAIRTSHNMPTPELVRLCDEMGFMMMLEPFDEWNIAKCRNGYHLFFDEWAEKDLVNMLHQYRNNPSIIFWSIGNEVPGQCEEIGTQTAQFLADIVRREDPTRFITCGMDQVACVLTNNFANVFDVPGLNYRTYLYEEAFETFPQKLVLGSETASTVSTRGVYEFPYALYIGATHPDRYSSSYDNENCWWSNIPDVDFALMEDYPWTIGQFVWTGYDYLGETTPYETMPNHSSNFGIIDLASIPKDRYYLYRSVWNPSEETLHILPHWNWEGREGEITPVMVYTNYPSAELFINGVSQGMRTKTTEPKGQSAIHERSYDLLNRHRLVWSDVRYESGEVKVVAYDNSGTKVAEDVVRTAGAAAKLVLKTDRDALCADGKDLIYIEVSAVDAQGNFCPLADNLVNFEVQGEGRYRAAANGDPTCLDLFHEPQMHLFNGKLTAIVQSSTNSGSLTFTASAPGLESATLTRNSVSPRGKVR